MLPLAATNVISGNVNLIMAFFIGLGFGFVLERSGLANSRKLAGMFYGYDAVVLKVFFTAALTAMIGVQLLTKLGFLDTGLVFVNPLFLSSAAAGGVMMGAGFIMAGYCPGTGLCALALGRIDALVFAIGMLAGVFLFAGTFETWKPLYHARSLGPLRVSTVLGLSESMVMLLAVGGAAVLFWAAEKAEKRFTRKDS